MLGKFFGDDVFVSYSRRDGLSYATGLANALTEAGFTCRIDCYESEPGRSTPAKVKRALRNSRLLVVVGTEAAASSVNVDEEIGDFTATGNNIVLLDCGAGLESAIWKERVTGLPVHGEQPASLATGVPSQNVLDLIARACTFRKRDQRIRRAFRWTAVGVAGLVAVGALVLWQTLQQIELNAALEAAGELRARRNAGVPPSVDDVVEAAAASDVLARLGREAEASSTLGEAVTLAPRLHASFEHPEGVVAHALSPSTGLLATAGRDGTLRLWNLAAAQPAGVFPLAGSVITLVTDAEGRRMVSGTREGDVLLWDLANPGLPRTLDRFRNLTKLAVDARGSRVALGSENGISIRSLRPEGGRVSVRSKGHITDMALMSKGAHLVVVRSTNDDIDDRLFVYDTTSGEPVYDEKSAEPACDEEPVDPPKAAAACDSGFRLFALERHGRHVASGCASMSTSASTAAECAVRLCELPAAEARTAFPTQAPSDVAFGPKRLLATEEGGVVRIWDHRKDRLVGTASPLGPAKGSGPPLQFSADGRRLATRHPEHLRVAEAATAEDVAILPLEAGEKLAGQSGDGVFAVTVAPKTGRIRVWKGEAVHRHASFHYRGGVSSFAFTPDGRYVLAWGRLARSSDERLLRVWEVESGRRLLELFEDFDDLDDEHDDLHDAIRPHNGAKRVEPDLRERARARLGPDDEYVVLKGGTHALFFSGPDDMRLFEFATQRETPLDFESLRRRREPAEASSPDGAYVAQRVERAVEVRRLADDTRVARISTPIEPSSLRFSPDGSYLAIASGGHLRLWRWRHEELVRATCELLARNAEAPAWGAALERSPVYADLCP